MAGIPIVASDLPVLREVLDLGNGAVRFHAPLDAEGLADAVRATLASYPTPEQRLHLAATFAARHSLAAMAERYLAFLDDRLVLSGTRGATHRRR